MSEIPTWWLVLSGLFFVANLAVLAVLAWVGIKIVAVLQEIKPRVDELSIKAGQTMDSVQTLSRRVDGIATSLRSTVDNVGLKAQNVGGSIERFSDSAGPQAARLVPIIGTAITVLKFAQAYRDMRLAKRRR